MKSKKWMIIPLIITLVFDIIIINIPAKNNKNIDQIEIIRAESISKNEGNSIEPDYEKAHELPYEREPSKLYREENESNSPATTPVVSEPSDDEETESSVASNQESSNEPSYVSETEYNMPNKIYKHYDRSIWVGDSRTNGLAGTVSIEYLAEDSKGLVWCKEHLPELYTRKGYNIIINFGVNDLGNLDNYINYYNSLPEDFVKNNQIFILSVNPVDEQVASSKGYSVKNATIEWFNDAMESNLKSNIYFLDSYDYLTKTGFNTTDGVHYTNDTYLKINNFVKKAIFK